MKTETMQPSNSTSEKHLILVELNEVNFDIARLYTEKYPGRFRVIEELLAQDHITTTSEARYDLLEPWIQWVSVHTGQTFEEHKVYRLGDMCLTDTPQFFELLEQQGYRVGSISAMNAANRMRTCEYFIPDPWTKTPSDKSPWSSLLSKTLAQVVNDNSQSRITLQSLLTLAAGLLRFSQLKHWPLYLRLGLRSRKAPWRKALLLDLFLNDLHNTLYRKKSPHFSTVFLNAGAHIQHHYFFNAQVLPETNPLKNPNWYIDSKEDPIEEMLSVYNAILADVNRIPNTEVIVATGLSQVPYDRAKFYYRLKNHDAFLKQLGIRFVSVVPRMTRDFLIQFESEHDATDAMKALSSIVNAKDGVALFEEIDHRGNTLFVTLTYPSEIRADSPFVYRSNPIDIYQDVVFVAVKNGMHHPKGYVFASQEIRRQLPPANIHVAALFNTVMNYFSRSEPK